MPADTAQDEVLRLVAELNADPAVHGILVQLPMPSHIDEAAVTRAVLPVKDVDGLHPVNAGYLYLGTPLHVPATPGRLPRAARRVRRRARPAARPS